MSKWSRRPKEGITKERKPGLTRADGKERVTALVIETECHFLPWHDTHFRINSPLLKPLRESLKTHLRKEAWFQGQTDQVSQWCWNNRKKLSPNAIWLCPREVPCFNQTWWEKAALASLLSLYIIIERPACTRLLWDFYLHSMLSLNLHNKLLSLWSTRTCPSTAFFGGYLHQYF